MEKTRIFEDWPYMLGKIGAPKKKHWWTELWERGSVNATGKGIDDT